MVMHLVKSGMYRDTHPTPKSCKYSHLQIIFALASCLNCKDMRTQVKPIYDETGAGNNPFAGSSNCTAQRILRQCQCRRALAWGLLRLQGLHVGRKAWYRQ